MKTSRTRHWSRRALWLVVLSAVLALVACAGRQPDPDGAAKDDADRAKQKEAPRSTKPVRD